MYICSTAIFLSCTATTQEVSCLVSGHDSSYFSGTERHFRMPGGPQLDRDAHSLTWQMTLEMPNLDPNHLRKQWPHRSRQRHNLCPCGSGWVMVHSVCDESDVSLSSLSPSPFHDNMMRPRFKDQLVNVNPALCHSSLGYGEAVATSSHCYTVLYRPERRLKARDSRVNQSGPTIMLSTLSHFAYSDNCYRALRRSLPSTRYTCTCELWRSEQTVERQRKDLPEHTILKSAGIAIHTLLAPFRQPNITPFPHRSHQRPFDVLMEIVMRLWWDSSRLGRIWPRTLSILFDIILLPSLLPTIRSHFQHITSSSFRSNLLIDCATVRSVSSTASPSLVIVIATGNPLKELRLPSGALFQ
nr:hypothetical protein CFP56_00237 [Quercus suber]